MLDQAAIERIQVQEGAMFQRWLREHVQPRVAAIQAAFPHMEYVPDAVYAHGISPFVYWLREQPLSNVVKQPVPATSGVSQIPSNGGGSLSNQPPSDYLTRHGLVLSNPSPTREVILKTRALNDPEFQNVNAQLKAWGYWSKQEVSEGKAVYYWEKGVGA